MKTWQCWIAAIVCGIAMLPMGAPPHPWGAGIIFLGGMISAFLFAAIAPAVLEKIDRELDQE